MNATCARIGPDATLIIGTSLSASTMVGVTAFHGSEVVP
jgi:hypothetical protein